MTLPVSPELGVVRAWVQAWNGPGYKTGPKMYQNRSNGTKNVSKSIFDISDILDISDVYDEDGMGPFNFTWQRTSPNTGWENYTEDDTEVLNLRQEHVSYTYRVRVEYIDGFDNREVIYSNESEAVRNVDDPVLGDVVTVSYTHLTLPTNREV